MSRIPLRIETARVVLTPCTVEDVDALHAFWTLPEVRRYLMDDRIISRDEALKWVTGSIASFSAEGIGQWVVRTPDGHDPIGWVGLKRLGEGGDVELLYALHPDHWGQGLAVETSREVLRHGFERAGLERIVAQADRPNRASIRVMERLGMRFEWDRVVSDLPLVQYEIDREAFACSG